MTLQDNPLDFNDVPPPHKGRTSRRMSVTRVAELLNDRIADLAARRSAAQGSRPATP